MRNQSYVKIPNKANIVQEYIQNGQLKLFVFSMKIETYRSFFAVPDNQGKSIDYFLTVAYTDVIILCGRKFEKYKPQISSR